MRRLRLLFSVVGLLWAAVAPACADGEIVVAIRVLLPEKTSHAHLFLFRADDGKLLRQLTRDDSGQDVSPVFSPDGETIVWTRELGEKVREYWSIRPRGDDLKRLPDAPAWYKAAAHARPAPSPFFTDAFPQGASSDAGDEPAPRFRTPDSAFELILRVVKSDPDTEYDGAGTGKHYLLHNVKTNRETEFGKLPGFVGAYELLHDAQTGKQRFLWENGLHLAFFSLHLNSTDGTTIFALDLLRPSLVRLSPNWAAPFPLPGQPAFLTLTEVRYVSIPHSTKTANSSYVERWDKNLHKLRYLPPDAARTNAAALCYGASLFRSNFRPAVVTIPAFTR